MSRGICVLASGGFDSCVLLGELLRRGQRVFPLYVRCGYSWEDAELHWLRRYLKALPRRCREPLVVAEAPMRPLLRSHWSLDRRRVPAADAAWETIYLPGRNLVLLSLAGIYCAQKGLHRIAIGSLKGNPFPDATPAFIRSMSRVMGRALGRAVEVRAPYRRLSKRAVLHRGRDLPLRLSFSCLNPKGLAHCGVCSKCGERDEALEILDRLSRSA
ncbi:MAG: 7-cyano-7-deazaguanine synthase [Elusimicrobia bacterium]|nr:7-cyano-7-deazaguanine synthase [Elusimicrobiota bacterium]